MNKIILHTRIDAPIDRCFELSTSIDLHKISASKSGERAIDAVTQGLIDLGETVTWKAKHFGIWHEMKVIITEFEKPNFFTDEMVKGSFKFMKHKHEFEERNGGTIMTDTFDFASPFGLIGRFVDKLILNNYMTNFLIERNEIIREYAESNKWMKILSNRNER